MRFSREEVDLLEGAREVEIETHAADGAVHRTIIWVVTDDGDVFVRSVNGSTARWYREARARPSVAIHVGARRIPAIAVHAPEPESVRRTTEGLARKYRGDPDLSSMLTDEILDTTIRLDAPSPPKDTA